MFINFFKFVKQFSNMIKCQTISLCGSSNFCSFKKWDFISR